LDLTGPKKTPAEAGVLKGFVEKFTC